MKRHLLTAAFLTLCCASASAQSLPDVAIPSDPAALAMGGMAVEGGAFAADNNMSALSFAPKAVNVGLSVADWAPSATFLKVAGAGLALHFGRVGIALGAKGNEAQPYTAYNDSWQPVGEFTPRNLYGSAGLSVRLSKHLALGVAGRYLYSSIADGYEATAWSGDASLTWNNRILQASAAVCNIGTPVLYAEGGTPGILPQMVRAGLAVNLWDCLRLGGEADYILNDGSIMFTAGAQYSLKNILFLRGGFHYAESSAVVPMYATAGASVRVFGVEIGAVWLTASEILGNSLSLSLSASF